MSEGLAFNPIDEHFGRFVERMAGEKDPGLFFAAALTSRAITEGHICLELSLMEGQRLSNALELLHNPNAHSSSPAEDSKTAREDKDPLLPELEPWLTFLGKRQFDGVISRADSSPLKTPLVLDECNRLYLQRYFCYERDLAGFFRCRETPEESFYSYPNDAIQKALDEYFFEETAIVDWQRVAAFAALRQSFLVISGGPGTGKTTTVTRILGFLQELRQKTGKGGETPPPLKVLLAAPTGKAAARLTEAVKQAKEKYKGLGKSLPETASTIHRMLGSKRGSSYFLKNRENPLDADIVVVDEASMVSLTLMAKLVDALAPQTKLILLGDMNQLAAVEPGHVLGDLCAASDVAHFSSEFACQYGDLSQGVIPRERRGGESLLCDCSVELELSHRFREGGLIDSFSKIVNSAKSVEDGKLALSLLKANEDGERAEIFCHSYDETSNPPLQMEKMVKEGYRGFFETRSAEAALDELEKFRILSPLKKGLWGVEKMNDYVEKLFFGGKNLGGKLADPFYDHRPIMICQNDYDLGLFNGDIGVILDTKGERVRKAWFKSAEGKLRGFSPYILPPHETCFALTVHKSQGSEFESLMLLLPNRDSPVLTKELIYTAVTRAKEEVGIFLNEKVFNEGIVRRTHSASGLFDALCR